MPIKIVHFSISPIAGAPLRLSRLLNHSSEIESRYIALKQDPIFGDDIVWTGTDEQKELVFSADIIHLHNYLHLNSSQFEGISFKSLKKNGKKILRQFHSSPQLICKFSNESLEELFEYENENPTCVISQFQERFFTKSYIVPNPVSEHKVTPEGNGFIAHSPSNLFPYNFDRWNTKSAVETQYLAKRFLDRKVELMHNMSHKDVIREKSLCSFAIDDLLTGSIHLSSLESMSMGLKTFCYLDSRQVEILESLDMLPPVVNTRISEILSINSFSESHKEKNSIMFREKWSNVKIASMYIDLYSNLFQDRDVERQLDIPCVMSERQKYEIEKVYLSNCKFILDNTGNLGFNFYKFKINYVMKLKKKLKGLIK
jgi:hypothetical protein